MAKSIDNTVLDAALDELATAVAMHICIGAPTNYTEATATNSAGSVVIDGTDFTNADGDVSGRKTTIAAQSGISATATGTVDHVALVKAAGSVLLAVTSLASGVAVTSGSTTMDVGAFKFEIQDPS